MVSLFLFSISFFLDYRIIRPSIIEPLTKENYQIIDYLPKKSNYQTIDYRNQEKNLDGQLWKMKN